MTEQLNGAEPVRWLSPSQLRKTAIEVVQGSIFARFADKREVLGGVPGVFLKLNEGSDEIWFDYVADTGDGYRATFATACSVMRTPVLDYEDPQCSCAPSRPHLVVFGGDQVYPTASSEEYSRRLDAPFTVALRMRAGAEGETPVLALPGNHDWYDGLVAFRRWFCESWTRAASPPPEGGDQGDGAEPTLTALPGVEHRDPVAGLGAVQSRPYFAVRLTSRWWVWGLDSQLDKPIDALQTRYFRDAATLLGDRDRIILCTATPSWLKADPEVRRVPARDTPLYTLARFLQRLPESTRDRVDLILTGDKHHYAHYRPSRGHGAASDEFAPELVTCGGGGAFLSSTHHLETSLVVPWGLQREPELTTHYTLGQTFPTAEQSREVSGGVTWLKVATRNGRLPLVVFAIQALLLLSAYWAWPSVDQLWETVERGRWPVSWPMLWCIVAVGALLGLLYAFADHGRESRTRRVAFGVAALHTAAQWLPALGVSYLLRLWDEAEQLDLVIGWGILAAFALGGWGLFALALYLHACDRLLGMHQLESYSGLRIEDYKSHLRVHVKGDSVTVHVLGIHRAPTFHDGELAERIRLEHVDRIDVPSRHG